MSRSRWLAKLILRFGVWGVIGFVVAAGIQACSSGPPVDGVKSDMLTDSDEPEVRKRARIRLELAVGYYNNGQTKIALDELKQSIAADPSMFEAYNLRGLIYMRLDNTALAEESFRKALSINPKAATVQHNYGWMLCQQSRFTEAQQYFGSALANPAYGDRAKTWMTQGLCQLKNNQRVDAEASLLRSYELDAGNPITGYNLALMMFERKDFVRAQFHVRRINNSELANAETLWLGIKVERQMENRDAMAQLGGQLKKRYPQSREFSAYERGAFDE
jgi:type IV pilus assembly protein PilF